jgi:CBS domain-containing protein
MSRNLRTVTPLTRLTRVLEILVSAGIKSLPVVDGDELVGIVSREDVVAALRRASAGERPAKLAENHA